MMDTELAVLLVALEAVASAAEAITWEDYPQVGEGDWLQVQAEVMRIARHPSRFPEAMTLLEKRAGQL